MLRNMLADLGHRVTNVGVGVEQMVMLLCFPVGERREFLRDRLEQAHDDTNRRGLHIIAELVDSTSILEESVAW